MKRSHFLSCALALVLASSPAHAAHRRARLLPAKPSFGSDTRTLWLANPARVDTVFHHDSTRVRRDSAMVDSTVRDSTRHPRPTPPPQRPRQRPRPRVVYLG